jgi:hypothetical protein
MFISPFVPTHEKGLSDETCDSTSTRNPERRFRTIIWYTSIFPDLAGVMGIVLNVDDAGVASADKSGYRSESSSMKTNGVNVILS